MHAASVPVTLQSSEASGFPVPLSVSRHSQPLSTPRASDSMLHQLDLCPPCPPPTSSRARGVLLQEVDRGCCRPRALPRNGKVAMPSPSCLARVARCGSTRLQRRTTDIVVTLHAMCSRRITFIIRASPLTWSHGKDHDFAIPSTDASSFFIGVVPGGQAGLSQNPTCAAPTLDLPEVLEICSSTSLSVVLCGVF